MLEIKIRTIWQGKIGVREKYIKQSVDTQQDLIFVKGNDYMIIPWDKIDEYIVGKSEQPVIDKFSNETHFLIYFKWCPTTKNLTLF